MLTEYSMGAAELATGAEDRGFESLWVPEHSHIPVSRDTPWPGDGELPEMYYDAMDPFITLAAAAAVTRTLKLATGICLVVQRDPIQTAKQVATLDRISQGRVLFGVGAGWNAEEMANHGTRNFRRRFALMRERIEAMVEIWTQDEAEYHGEFVDFDPIISRPQPVQKPHPPIHLGGDFPAAARRAIRYGDGWMPNPAFHSVFEKLEEFRRMAADAGRDPDSLEVSVFGVGPDGDSIQAMRDAGIDRVVCGLPPASAEKVLPLLDRYTSIMQAVG